MPVHALQNLLTVTRHRPAIPVPERPMRDATCDL
jgi:hypothetical protein